MTRLGLAAALFASVAIAVSAAAPEVTVDGLEVRIVADGSRLDQLLSELARATEMEIIYEAAPPSIDVTAQLQAPTPAEAVIRLLDSLPVSYALQLDASGERVTKLWIAGKGSGSRPRQRPARAGARAPRRPPRPVPETEEPEGADSGGGDVGAETIEPAVEAPSRIAPRAFPTPLLMPTPPSPAATPTPGPER